MKRHYRKPGFLARASSFAAAPGGDTRCGYHPAFRAEARPAALKFSMIDY
jgi:hypothetical protein